MKPNDRELEIASKIRLAANDNWTIALATALANYREELRHGRSPVETLGGVRLDAPKWDCIPNALFVPLDQPTLSIMYALAYGLEECAGRVIKRSGIECHMMNPPQPTGLAVWFEKEKV